MQTFSKAVFLDRASVGDDVDLSALAPLAGRWSHHSHTAPDQVIARIRDAELVLSNKVRLDADTLAACERLRLVCITATGTNNIDLEAARKFGIAVCNVTGYATASVVQHVFALLLTLTNRIGAQQAAARDRRWARSRHFCVLDTPFVELAGKTLGIVGHGELGKAVARTAEAFGMRCLVARRPGASDDDRPPLATVLREADVVSLHVPLADNTRNLIGEAQLALMKPTAVLINTARGGIVDEPALLAALREGRLGGAGVDVLAQEPPVDGNPLLDADLPNLIVTPHVAWAAWEARQRLMDEVARNILAFMNGTPRNRVV